VADKLRFHLDEHVNPRIAQGLRRRGIDVTTTNDAGLRMTDDDAQLTYVRTTERVLVTCDAGFVARHTAGENHYGIIFYNSQSRSVGEMIAYLALMVEVMDPEEMRNRLEYA
jgi:predicted nuclease of predicted toxin-antitoxin system